MQCKHIQDNENCGLLGVKALGDKCRCPYYTDGEIAVCDLCGTFDPAYRIDESGRRICRNCSSRLGTCAMCENVHECAFENDPSSLPKTIRQTVQNAGFIMQQDIPNPERIRQTCQNGCSCFREDLGCLKQNGTCGNYKER